jgi:DNA-binding transcriptional ArsR family regulator
MIFVMRDLLYLERVEEAETLLKPRRIEVLRQLAEPRSCTEVAACLDQTQQRVYYHVKRLVEHGLVTQVAERRVRGINEGVYQATARAYWLSPRLVGRIGQRQQRDEACADSWLADLAWIGSRRRAGQRKLRDRTAYCNAVSISSGSWNHPAAV